MAGLPPGQQISGPVAPTTLVIPDIKSQGPQSAKPRVSFMKPFKIYENFRSAVYRGVGKNSSNVYEVCDSEDVEDFSNEEEYDSVGSSTASSGCETECQNSKHGSILHVSSSSLALDTRGSNIPRRSPILMLAVINDGNTTDDSGIDSINCDSAMSPAGDSPTRDMTLLQLTTLDEEYSTQEVTTDSEYDNIKSSKMFIENVPLAIGINVISEQEQKSFLYDKYTVVKGQTGSHHQQPKLISETAVNASNGSSVWKKELVISGNVNEGLLKSGRRSVHSSREDLCDLACGSNDGVELTSVRTGLCSDDVRDTKPLPIYSKVKKSSIQKKNGLQVSEANHDVITFDICTKNDSDVQWDEHDTSGIKSIKKNELHHAEEKHESITSTIISQVPLGALRKPKGQDGDRVLSQDLTELSEFLASTNHVLQRNSNLRASLTIHQVKKTSSGAGLSRSGSNAAKLTATPKNVRKTVKSKTDHKSQKNLIKTETKFQLSPRWPTHCKDKVIGGSPHVKRKFAINPTTRTGSSSEAGSSDMIKKGGFNKEHSSSEVDIVIMEEGNHADTGSTFAETINRGSLGEDHYEEKSTIACSGEPDSLDLNLEIFNKGQLKNQEEKKITMTNCSSGEDREPCLQLNGQMAVNRNQPKEISVGKISGCSNAKTGQATFVRGYRGHSSMIVSNNSYRKSMTIRPQTVANLANKFDTIVKDNVSTSKSNNHTGLKLRTYDITKIIGELNKLNKDENKSSDPSSPGCTDTGSLRRGNNSPYLSHQEAMCLRESGSSETNNNNVKLTGGDHCIKSQRKQDSAEPQSSPHADFTVSSEQAGTTKCIAPLNAANDIHLPEKLQRTETDKTKSSIISSEEQSMQNILKHVEKHPTKTNIPVSYDDNINQEQVLSKKTDQHEKDCAKIKKTISNSSFKDLQSKVTKPPTSDSPAARYLAALSPAGGSLLGRPACRGTVSLGHSVTVRPSVRQTQQLLLQKTGGLPSPDPAASQKVVDGTKSILNSSSKRTSPVFEDSTGKSVSRDSLIKDNDISTIKNPEENKSVEDSENIPTVPNFKIGVSTNSNTRQEGRAQKSILESIEEAQTKGKDRTPNSSFLWNKAHGLPVTDDLEFDSHEHSSWKTTKGSLKYEDGSPLEEYPENDDDLYERMPSGPSMYDDVGVGSVNYQLIENYKNNPMNHSYMDIASVRYHQMENRKSPDITASYDDISNLSSHKSQEKILRSKGSPLYLSADNLSSIHYDDIGNLAKYERRSERTEGEISVTDSSDGPDKTFDATEDMDDDEKLYTSSCVKATPAVILEDQHDSISYIYDDIGAGSPNNGDIGLYESIAGSILNLAKTKLGTSFEDLYSSYKNNSKKETDIRRLSYLSHRSNPGPHEVNSYTLSNMKEGQGLEMENGEGTYKFHGDVNFVDQFSLRGSNRSSNPSFSTLERKSITSDRSDEWVDIETDEDYEEKQFTRPNNFVRSSVRVSNRRRFSRGSARLGQGWNRAVRDVLGNEETYDNEAKSEEEDLYESIYEVIRTPGSESDFEEIPEEEDEEDGEESERDALYGKSSNLSKIAEAAGRKMKKLKTNWSIKKNDITRSLSKSIKKTSRPVVSESKLTEGKSGNAARRKVTRRMSNVNMENVEKGDDTMFYITLTLEEDGQPPVNIIPSNYGDSDMDSNTYSQMSTDSGSGIMRSITPNNLFPSVTCQNKLPPRRRKSSTKTPYAVVRPLVPPPAPPPSSSCQSFQTYQPSSTSTPFQTPIKCFSTESPFDHSDNTSPSDLSSNSSLNSMPHGSVAGSFSEHDSSEQTDSLLPCDSLKEFYMGFQCGPIPPSLSTHVDDVLLDAGTGLPLADMEETYTSSLFQTEPLYQFYDKDSSTTDTEEDVSDISEFHEENDSPMETVENMYESVENLLSVTNVGREKTRSKIPKTSRCSAMDIVISNTGRRSLWAELPEVIESGILHTISSDEKKLQEAMFEVISSEASYLKSLNILISNFIQSNKFSGESSVLTKMDQRILFSEVILVRSCSERFLSDLESRWQESVLLSGICDIIRDHARDQFQVYVKYCSNQVYQDRTLKRLKLESPKFVEALKELESSQACQSLAMHSFLMLPMQRITRLPLLTDAISSRLKPSSPELESCSQAMELLNSLVQECNESARSMERMEELLILSQQLDFRDVKAIPLISASRWLVKRGDCVRINWKEGGDKLTFGRRVSRHNLALFLFTDLLLVTKRKGEERFLVLDYSPRNMIQVTELESSEGIPGLGEQQGYALWLTLLQNHENKTQEMLISFCSESDRGRWKEAVTPASSEVGSMLRGT